MRAAAALFLLSLGSCTPGARTQPAGAPPPPPPPAADLVLLGGRILTVDSLDRVAQAIAIRGARIVAVGSDAEIRPFIGAGTRRIELAGRTVTPGLIDAHAHFAEGAAFRSFVLDVSYPAVRSVADIAAAVGARARDTPAGEWITGHGWDEGKLDEKRLPAAADLDAAASRHPVFLFHTTGHYAVANTAALRLAGITRETPDPPGGTIDRAPDGTPTGVLRESAQDLVARLVPPFTPEQLAQAIRELSRAFNAEGMTAVKDPGIDDRTWDAYRRVADESALTVRVFVLWGPVKTVADARQLVARRGAITKPWARESDLLIAGGAKLFADGSGGARTAWMHEPWNRDFSGVDGGNVGYPALDPDTLRRIMRVYHDAGMHVSVHAIGDRMIDWVVDSYAEALAARPTHGLRHGIIHANIPTPHALRLIADLQRRHDAAYPEPSATFMWWIGDTYAANFGAVRARRLNPFRTFQQSGIRWANSSDYGVTPFPARYGLWASVARRTLLDRYGDAFGRDEAVDIRTALRSATTWAARQLFLEDRVGSIEPGKLADLAVWDRDFYSIPTDAIRDAKCLLTIFNGRVVFQADDGAPPVRD